ncbi:LexA family protein [Sodalis sp. RH22]|uniref:LexA family protein n=1 Tax=unclassified Sodalis (in: enterobacteria) TaxID=2636512 RepID=UPI0039B68CB2
MENKDIRRLNLLWLMDKYQREEGLNKAQFAERCGTSASTLSQITGENSVRNLGDNLARKIEEALKLNAGWLDSLHADNAVERSNVSYVGPHVHGNKYPLISLVSAGAWSEANEPYALKDIDEWYESDAKIQGEAFWLRVEGDSMTAPTGLSIPENTLVLFDTGRDAVNGSLVIAKLTDVNEATFKKLIIDGGQRFLRGLNPAWPLMPINGNCKIIGVAIETKMRLI